jgi:chloramphenicol-sensitive protein RarD
MALGMSSSHAPDGRAAASTSAAGLGYGLLAYASWGLAPIFWKALARIPAGELVAHRTIWGLATFAGLAFWRGHGPAMRAALRNPRTLRTLMLSALLLSSNWLIFIYATISGRVIEASLGYFINPLVNVLLGMLLLGERLRRMQWLSVGLASLGVLALTVQTGGLPWISLFLGVSFALYAYLRKTVAVDALPGSTVETLCMMPLAIGYLVWPGTSGHFGQSDVTTQVLLLSTGAITALPLLWFTHAARRLPLTTLGFLQYLSPTTQFLLAVLVYGESFTPAHQQGFSCIWAGLLVFSVDTWSQARSRRQAVRAARAATAEAAAVATADAAAAAAETAAVAAEAVAAAETADATAETTAAAQTAAVAANTSVDTPREPSR